MKLTRLTGSRCHVHRINHAYDRRIDGDIFHALSQSRARARNDQYSFMVARADRIHGHDITGCVGAINVYRANDEQLFSKEAFVFLR